MIGVGVATGYGLDGSGFDSCQCKIFLFFTASKPILGPTQPPIKWVRGAPSPRVKRQGR
jgi:hypothetical protein